MTSPSWSRPNKRVPGDPILRFRDEKLEALKAVVGKLAHDFNNFLVPQFGYLTLLKEEVAEGSTAAQYAATMEATGRRTEAYIESILLGMRPHRQFAPAEFSLSKLLGDLLDTWQADVPASTEIKVTRQIESFNYCGDERHWKNALTHILDNARYALATGGALHVELKKVVLEPTEVVRLGLEADHTFQLIIQDSGFGMDAGQATRAFEPFFTTRGQVKATGLGLTIVHSVVQFHGGQVELVSEQDRGTTVTLWIPIEGSAAREKLSSIRGFKSEAKQKKKVLLIGDDPLVNEVLRDWLGRFDLEVYVASEAQAAAKTFERKRTEWALVLSETDLRGTRGEDIYEKLHPTAPTLPWIFLVGRRKPEFPPETLHATPPPLVMHKPVTLRSLGEVVCKHVADA